MYMAVLSNLLNLMRCGTSGIGVELSWEEDSAEFIWVDIDQHEKEYQVQPAEINQV